MNQIWAVQKGGGVSGWIIRHTVKYSLTTDGALDGALAFLFLLSVMFLIFVFRSFSLCFLSLFQLFFMLFVCLFMCLYVADSPERT